MGVLITDFTSSKNKCRRCSLEPRTFGELCGLCYFVERSNDRLALESESLTVSLAGAYRFLRWTVFVVVLAAIVASLSYVGGK